MPIRTRSELIDLVTSGARVKFLHFWGHHPQRDDSIGAGCLSNWWPAAFEVDGNTFATAEHWMMWSKAILFNDPGAAAEILVVSHPHAAKAIGRRVVGFDQATWEKHRYAIVVAGCTAKFSQHKDLKDFLLTTGDRVLVEASPRDRIWGIGMGAANPNADDPTQWRGQNLLGFALMEARASLREHDDR
jgi:ribA/ribD-fused uncharacterized protein